MKAFAPSMALGHSSAAAAFAAAVTTQRTLTLEGEFRLACGIRDTQCKFRQPKFFDDPRKKLPFSRVYSWMDGRLRLVTQDTGGRSVGRPDGGGTR